MFKIRGYKYTHIIQMIEIFFKKYIFFHCFFGYEKNIEINFVYVYLK